MLRARSGLLGPLLVLTLAACAAAPSPTGSAAPSRSSVPSTPPATPSPEPSTPASEPPSSQPPSPSPTGSPEPTASPIVTGAPRVGSIAVVVTGDLRVRSKPGVSADSKLLTPLLQQSMRAYVLAGPVSASGYDWYQIQPFHPADEFGDLPFGWVAAADHDGTSWLALDATPCGPTPATVDELTAIPGPVGLACFGSTPFTVSARLAQPEATCGVDLGWTIEPDWLASTCPQPRFLVESATAVGLSINSILDPKVDPKAFKPGVEPADWIAVTLTVRFDHPAARTCHGVSSGSPVPYPRDQIVLSCRSTWVITKIARA